MKCKDCEAFKLDDHNPDCGECRRNSPTVGFGFNNGKGLFPVTGSDDWCYESVEKAYSEKKELPDA